jgi:hypothetical protein
MTAPPDPPRSKGMMMIAAYRAERLNQRPVLRTSLHQSRLALRQGRDGGQVPPAPDPSARGAASPPLPAPEAADPASVFANLVSLAVAERHGETMREENAREENARQENARQEDAATVAPMADPGAAGAAPANPAQVATPPAAPAMPIVVTQPVPAPSAPEACPAATPPAESPPVSISAPVCVPQPLVSSADQPPADHPPAEAPSTDVPLAAIGFGPGMLIRLGQLGLHTARDLAEADAMHLRAALGDISRLVDVETWISNARELAPAVAA